VATEALRKIVDAQHRNLAAEQLGPTDRIGAHFLRAEADKLRDEGELALALPETPRIMSGELELVTDEIGDRIGTVSTIENPDLVTVEASRDRLDLLGLNNTVALGIDAAETVQARNSIEKMLVHSMAAAHQSTMKMFACASDELRQAELCRPAERHEAQLAAARLLNAAARLMTAYQDGMLALARVRSGGRQTVVVQHVVVEEGGKALVTGHIDGDRGLQTGGIHGS